jgi:hypothetical protein
MGDRVYFCAIDAIDAPFGRFWRHLVGVFGRRFFDRRRGWYIARLLDGWQFGRGGLFGRAARLLDGRSLGLVGRLLDR